MSKVGKRAFLLLLAIPIVINVMAQETKKPTLEELIPGGESYLYAENLYGLQWWGDECIKPGVDTLYSIQPKTGKETISKAGFDRACFSLKPHTVEKRKDRGGMRRGTEGIPRNAAL